MPIPPDIIRGDPKRKAGRVSPTYFQCMYAAPGGKKLLGTIPCGEAVVYLQHLWPRAARRRQHGKGASTACGGHLADAPLPGAPREKLAARHVLQESVLDALGAHSNEHLALKSVHWNSKGGAYVTDLGAVWYLWCLVDRSVQ